MTADAQWKLDLRARSAALAAGEDIAKLNGFTEGPVDPFAVIASESDQIHAEGDDFRDIFDGRLSYHNGRFLLVYNTRYNVWPRRGEHHPKVRFTVAHELGHYYLDRHREFLVTRHTPIESFTEFESNNQVEREADAFATGLLMPKYLLTPIINCEPDATIRSIKEAATEFDVSLTSMMVRWTQLSHFPSVTICIRDGLIQWGFVSEAFRQCGLWQSKRDVAPKSTDALQFLNAEPTLSNFREGVGHGLAQNWLEGDSDQIAVEEYYVVIPYSRCVMVFLSADEDDLPTNWNEPDW